jgi:hypothetical protein
MNLVKIELDVTVIRSAHAALVDRATNVRRRAKKTDDAGLRSLLERQASSYERDAATIHRALAAVGFNAGR